MLTANDTFIEIEHIRFSLGYNGRLDSGQFSLPQDHTNRDSHNSDIPRSFAFTKTGIPSCAGQISSHIPGRVCYNI